MAIYGISRIIVGNSHYIWPAQITQSYVGDCPANTVDCQTLQILLTKTYNRRFLANPTDKYARQWSSSPLAWSSTGSHICQLDLLGIADYIVFANRICNVCAILPPRLWQVGIIEHLLGPRFGTNVANPIAEDDIIGDAEQIQLTNMRASGAPSRRRGVSLASIFVSWICEESPIIGLCQWDLQR